MSKVLKRKLICLINIFNSAARLTCYDTNPYVVSILDTSYEQLEPYKKYWVDTDPIIGNIVLLK